ncbi:MAG TPA: LytTR family DNA-binding domain-containing protein [Rhodocyclaceae bacterium]|nr:LytTR family DNA-binding domain-containing protein [Rhodocyclaceae bacterium]
MSEPLHAPLHILLVDDEAPARLRLTQLLADLAPELPNTVVGEAGSGGQTLALLQALAERGVSVDVALVDIRMPGMDGIELTRFLKHLPQAPAVVFVTAFEQHAVQAFDLAAMDYLVKPVRAARLKVALEKVRASRLVAAPHPAMSGMHIPCTERGRVLLIPVAEIIYLRAEQKYVTARTAAREHLLDVPLVQLERDLGDAFLRIHRNCLVARAAIAGFERIPSSDPDPIHRLLLKGLAERLPISRRQWPVVKQVLMSGAPAGHTG